MSDIDAAQLRRLDFTLLLVFAEIMRHRKLTAAAIQLGLTQSAISHSLKRMRQIFADELFLRKPWGVEPTPRAAALEPRVAEIIALTRDTLKLERTFDPKSSKQHLRVGALDYAIALFSGPVMNLMRQQSPAMRFSMVPVARDAALAGLDHSSIDIALGFFPRLPERYVCYDLYEENYAVVAGRRNKFSRGKPTLDAYLKAQHLLVSLDGGLRGIVDVTLQRLGKRRHVTASLPLFLPALAAVADTDLIATVPRRLAHAYAASFGLKIMPVPLKIRSFTVSAITHRRADKDGATFWLRERLRDAATRLEG
jgi:DNA-binding transcriptional LysR family regulator